MAAGPTDVLLAAMWLVILAAGIEMEVRALGRANVVAVEPGDPGSTLYARAESAEESSVCDASTKCEKDARCPLWCALQIVRDKTVDQECRAPPGGAARDCAAETAALQELLKANRWATVQERAKACLKRSEEAAGGAGPNEAGPKSLCVLTHAPRGVLANGGQGPVIDLAPGEYLTMDLKNGISRMQALREWADAEQPEDGMEPLDPGQQLHLDHLPSVTLKGTSGVKVVCASIQEAGLSVLSRATVVVEQVQVSGCAEGAVVLPEATLVLRKVEMTNIEKDGIRVESNGRLELYATKVVAREDGITGSARMASAREDWLIDLADGDAVSRFIVEESEEQIAMAQRRALAWTKRGDEDREEEDDEAGKAFNNIHVKIMEGSHIRSGEDGLAFRGRACVIEMDNSILETTFHQSIQRAMKVEQSQQANRVAKNAAGDGIILGENSQFLGNRITSHASQDSFAIGNNAKVSCIECVLTSSATDDELIELKKKAAAGDRLAYEKIAPGTRRDEDRLVLINLTPPKPGETITFGARYMDGDPCPGACQLLMRDIEGSGVRDAVLAGYETQPTRKAKAAAAVALLSFFG